MLTWDSVSRFLFFLIFAGCFVICVKCTTDEGLCSAKRANYR
jgi:hypothetical protein